jgi:hypothetical protein
VISLSPSRYSRTSISGTSVKGTTGYPNSGDRSCAERQYTCLHLFPDFTCSCMLYIRVASVLSISVKYCHAFSVTVDGVLDCQLDLLLRYNNSYSVSQCTPFTTLP